MKPGASAQMPPVVAPITPLPPLLCFGRAETCLRPLPGPFELTKAHRTGRTLAVGLGLVQLVALPGVFSLHSQIIKVFDGHERE
jgi:hypothetical protein